MVCQDRLAILEIPDLKVTLEALELRVQLASLVFEDQKVTKVRADHWERKVTKATRDMTVRKVMWVRKANEDRKAFRVLPVWKDLKDPKVSKAREVKLDHLARRERKENWAFQVSLDILDHLAKKETKAHQDGLAHRAIKETEATLELQENVENRVRVVSEDPAAVRANKASQDLKVTLDSPAHQAHRESEVYPERKESVDLPDNRVFLVFMAKMA